MNETRLADRYREQLYPYRYFVSYAHAGGFGHIAIDRTHPVLNMLDAQEMADRIANGRAVETVIARKEIEA